MGRKRNTENRGLPKRWKHQHGAYYYRVPPGEEAKWKGKKMYRLGKTLPEAYREWSSRLEERLHAKTVNDLLDRYALEVIPTKAKTTQYLNRLYLKPLRDVFGGMDLEEIEPIHIYRYIDMRRIKKKVNGKITGGPSIARREIAMFSNAFTKAIKWGYIRKHPWLGQVEFDKEKGRDRYVENWEFAEFISLPPKRRKDPTLFIQAYCKLKIITGMRKQDMLNLKITDLTDDGIYVKPLKTSNSTGKAIIIQWTPALKEAINECLAVRPTQHSFFVFCNRRGESYYKADAIKTTSGFDSIFGRYMDRAIEETRLQERFVEHDLRAKTASDLEDINKAQKLLAHSSIRMTRGYMRKPVKVEPAK